MLMVQPASRPVEFSRPLQYRPAAGHRARRTSRLERVDGVSRVDGWASEPPPPSARWRGGRRRSRRRASRPPRSGEPATLRISDSPRMPATFARQPAERADRPHRLGEARSAAGRGSAWCASGVRSRGPKPGAAGGDDQPVEPVGHVRQGVRDLLDAVGAHPVLDDVEAVLGEPVDQRPPARVLARAGRDAVGDGEHLRLVLDEPSDIRCLLESRWIGSADRTEWSSADTGTGTCRRCRRPGAAGWRPSPTVATAPPAARAVSSSGCAVARRGRRSQCSRPRSACRPSTRRCRRGAPAAAAASMRSRCSAARRSGAVGDRGAIGRRLAGAGRRAPSTGRRTAPRSTRPGPERWRVSRRRPRRRRRRRRRVARAFAAIRPTRDAAGGPPRSPSRRPTAMAVALPPGAAQRSTTTSPGSRTDQLGDPLRRHGPGCSRRRASVTDGGSFIASSAARASSRPRSATSRSTTQSG